MRIGYFGGSFDPPHRGHLAVARLARDQFALDRVLLAPTARQPLKREGPEASWTDRLQMTGLLCAGEPRLEASAIDGPQPNDAPNYTVDTLRRLHSCFPATAQALQIFAILGADAFLGFGQWREPNELVQLADWIIVSRPGSALPQPHALTPKQRSHLHLLTSLADPLSATALRARLHAGEDCAGLVPPDLLAYLLKNHLYGTGAP